MSKHTPNPKTDHFGGPARRHACEVCRKIFECHLCDIWTEHPIHGNRKQHRSQNVYVCPKCCEKPEFHFVSCTDYGTKGYVKTKWFDQRTGQVVRRNERKVYFRQNRRKMTA